MYWDHMNGSDWSMMVVWTVLWVALLAVVVWAVAQWVRGSAAAVHESQAPGSLPPRSARELLDERLARGEIDLGEYQRLRDALEPRAPAGV